MKTSDFGVNGDVVYVLLDFTDTYYAHATAQLRDLVRKIINAETEWFENENGNLDEVMEKVAGSIRDNAFKKNCKVDGSYCDLYYNDATKEWENDDVIKPSQFKVEEEDGKYFLYFHDLKDGKLYCYSTEDKDEVEDVLAIVNHETEWADKNKKRDGQSFTEFMSDYAAYIKNWGEKK